MKGVISMAFRKKVSLLGFIIGAVVDIGGTNIWAIVMAVYVVFSFRLSGLPPTEIGSRIMQIFQTDPMIFTVNLLVGSFFSILGGYLAALIAKHDEILNGGLSCFLCVLSGIYAIVSGSASASILLVLVSLVMDILLGLLGGYLRLLQRSRGKQALLKAEQHLAE